MAKKSSVARNEKRKILAVKYMEKRAHIKDLIKSAIANENIEALMDAQKKLQMLPRNGNPNRIRNRCFHCGKPRGVRSKYGLCDCCIARFLERGQLPGVTIASW